MKNFIVTIARESGSGGRAIGEARAAKLGVEFYNRDLLRLASEESGISEELFAKANERVSSTLMFRVVKDACNGEVLPPTSNDFISTENLFRYQARIILQLAQSSSCVVMGHCADYILRDCKNVIRVFVHAPEEARVHTFMERHHMQEDAARREMNRVDKQRAAYYRTFTGKNWRDVRYYDLSLDTSKLTQEECLDRICGYLALTMPETL